MTKYVKTDYVPEDCDYLTAGKVYEVSSFFGEFYKIVSDRGGELTICGYHCAHLDNRHWTVWEE